MNLCKTSNKRSDDEVHVYLITIAGTPDAWQSFGHSTLWISDGRNNSDYSYNWGTFDPNQPNLIGSFLQGNMNYWLNAVEFHRDFLRYTKYDKRTLIAQKLHLTQAQAIKLTDILREEAKPENRMFTYDWATNSCATKIRDRLNTILDDELSKLKTISAPRTMRQEGLRYLNGKPELWFLWDRSISYSADVPVTLWDTAYSPYMLSQILDQIEIMDGEEQVPLVDYTCLVNGTYPMPPENPPDHRLPLGLFSVCTSSIIAILSKRNNILKTIKKITLSIFMIVSSLLGILVTIHTLLWFSKLSYLHPNTNTLISGPQILLWTILCWNLIKETNMSTWLIRGIQICSILAIGTSIWEISPFGWQDNTAQICLFLPFHIVFLYLVSTQRTNQNTNYHQPGQVTLP